MEGFTFPKGKYLHVDMDMLKLLSDSAIETALALDHAVTAKFGLQRKPHERWLAAKAKGSLQLKRKQFATS